MNPSKPTALKKLQGTYRKHREVESPMDSEVKNIEEIPTPPKFITEQKEGERTWYKVCSGLSGLGILNQYGLEIIEDYCNQYAIMKRCQKKLSRRIWQKIGEY